MGYNTSPRHNPSIAHSPTSPPQHSIYTDVHIYLYPSRSLSPSLSLCSSQYVYIPLSLCIWKGFMGFSFLPLTMACVFFPPVTELASPFCLSPSLPLTAFLFSACHRACLRPGISGLSFLAVTELAFDAVSPLRLSPSCFAPERVPPFGLSPNCFAFGVW